MFKICTSLAVFLSTYISHISPNIFFIFQKNLPQGLGMLQYKIIGEFRIATGITMFYSELFNILKFILEGCSSE